MILYSKTGYHSTRQKGLKEFDSFTSDDKAYTGEGAMVHGWGLYVQADKELNIENYKNRFGQQFRPIVTLTDRKTNESHTYRGEDIQHGRYDGNTYLDEDGNKVNYILNNALDDITMGTIYDAESDLKHYNDLLDNIDNGEREKVLRESQLDRQWNEFRDNDDMEYRNKLYNKFLKEVWDINGKDDVAYENLRQEIGTTSLRESWREYLNNNVFTVDKEVIRQNIESERKQWEEKIKYWTEYLHYRNDYHAEYSQESFGNASQYTVEIPDDFVFLEEESFIYDTPLKGLVNDIVTELVSHIDELTIEELTNHAIGNGASWIREGLTPQEQKRRFIIEFGSGSTGEHWYKYLLPKLLNVHSIDGVTYADVSKFLFERGIDGIHYNGGEDGECWVIFNCKDLQIVKEE